MELLKVTQINSKNPIPVFGIEPDIKSNQVSNTEDTCSRIAKCAYYKAEARGFEPGHEVEDWLVAEVEVG